MTLDNSVIHGSTVDALWRWRGWLMTCLGSAMMPLCIVTGLRSSKSGAHCLDAWGDRTRSMDPVDRRFVDSETTEGEDAQGEGMIFKRENKPGKQGLNRWTLNTTQELHATTSLMWRRIVSNQFKPRLGSTWPLLNTARSHIENSVCSRSPPLGWVLCGRGFLAIQVVVPWHCQPERWAGYLACC